MAWSDERCVRSGGVFEFSCDAAWSEALVDSQYKIGQKVFSNLRIESGLEVDLSHLLQQQCEQILHILRGLISR